MSGQLQGERRSHKRGQSVEFADFRPYTPGDDFRRIDWNAYARLERFFIKLFVEEEDLTVHLLVDVSRSMDWGQPNKLDYSLRAAGALGYIALAGLDRVTVTVLGATSSGNGKRAYFAPHRGKQSAAALFSFLEAFLPTDQSPVKSNFNSASHLNQEIQSYAARATSPGPIIIISDFFETLSQSPNSQIPKGHNVTQSLNSLAAKGFEVTLLHTLSPDEFNPDLTGDLKLLDSENGAEVEITVDFDLLQRYRGGLIEWQNELRNFCGARGIHYVPVVTNIPLEELLFAWMRQYAVLK